MRLLGPVRSALRLLERRDRVRFGLVMAAQASLAVLDLVAVGLLGAVALLAAGAASNAIPPQLERAIDLLGVGDIPVPNLSIAIAGIAGLLMVSKSALSFYFTQRIFRFLARRQAAISSSLCARVLARPLLDIQERASQDVAYAVTLGVNALTLGVIGNFALMFSELTLLAVLAVGLLWIDPLMTAFTVAFFGLVALILVRILSKRAQTIGGRNASTQIASIESIQELLLSYREVSVAGRRGIYVEQFKDLRWEYASIQASSYILMQVGKYVLEVALIIGAALLASIQLLTKDLAAAAATLAVFLGAVSRIMPSMLRLQAAILGIRNQTGIAEPTLALADQLDAAEASDHDVSIDLNAVTRERLKQGLSEGFSEFTGRISIDSVSLTYPGADQAALVDVNLEIPAASSVALVGPTGAGKSTLADIILGVVEPDLGSVSVSGLSPKEAVLRWPGALAYVAQETALVNGDVRTNIALGLPDSLVDDDRVWEALAKARLADFVASLPDGLQATVGENGVRLSGGQRQRLGIARALYTRPRVLVLDEATSALDAETEDAITKTLGELGGEVTLVVVAHRLATVRHLDQVAYLERGQIQSLGSFEEVRSEVTAFDRQATLLGL